MKPSMIVLLIAAFLTAGLFTGCATYTPPPASGATDSDTQLVKDVVGRLANDDVAERFTFGVTAQGGVVTVQGAIPDELTRQRVLAVVRGTPGVQGVVDRMYRL